MTSPFHRPKNLTEALYRLSEECHELGKVACKAGRFGIDDINHAKGKSNYELMREEFEDVKDAIADVIKFYPTPVSALCAQNANDCPRENCPRKLNIGTTKPPVQFCPYYSCSYYSREKNNG